MLMMTMMRWWEWVRMGQAFYLSIWLLYYIHIQYCVEDDIKKMIMFNKFLQVWMTWQTSFVSSESHIYSNGCFFLKEKMWKVWMNVNEMKKRTKLI